MIVYYLKLKLYDKQVSLDVWMQDQPGVRCSHLIKDGQPLAYLQENVRTLYDTFQQGKKASG